MRTEAFRCVITPEYSGRTGTDSAGQQETKRLRLVFHLVVVEPSPQAGLTGVTLQ